jgi:tetratricopeptide (TPR) repeat protein
MTEGKNHYLVAMERGHNAAWDQDWQSAAKHYRLALEDAPDDPNALVSLGLALFELGSYQQSLKYYSQAEEVSPENPLAFDRTSQLYELLGQNEEVIPPALRASELYLREGNIAKSVECLVRVNRVDAKNLPAHSRLALIYERTGRKQQAVTEFLIVASIMQNQGDVENAKQAAEHALSIQPTSREAQEALSLIGNGIALPLPAPSKVDSVQFKRGSSKPVEPEGVSKEQVPEVDPVAEAHQTALAVLANLVFEQESNAGVLESRTGRERISSSQQGDPKTAFKHLQNAVVLHGQGSEELAADELEMAVETGLDHPAAYFTLGVIRSRGERLESATRYLQRTLDDEHYILAARIMIARMMRFKGRLSEAATNYLEALRFADAQVVPEEQREDMLRMYDPIIEAEAKQSDPEAKNKLCDLIEEMLFRPDWQQHLIQSRGDYQIDVDGAPAIPVGEVLTNPQGYRIVESVRTINRYARSGFLRSAMEEAYFAIQFAPTYLPLHTYMGELLLKQEHLKEAIEKFGAIAQTYRARGEMLHAEKILQRLIKAAPMDLEARKQLITLQEERGQYDQAVQEKVNLAGVYYNLADLTRAHEVYLDAYQLAQNTGSNSETSINILHNLADIEIQRLDWKYAAELYEQIKSIKPDDSQAAEKLIELKLRSGRDQQAQIELDDYISFMEISGNAQSVLAYLEKLVDEYPERTYLRRKKAALHLKAGQNEAAIMEYDAIGESLLEAGDTQGALQAIEAIVDLNPPNKNEYQELIGKLEEGAE